MPAVAPYQKLTQKGPGAECDAAKYIGQIAETLGSLHAESPMHRNIVSDNISLESNTKAKLGGFRHTTRAPDVMYFNARLL